MPVGRENGVCVVSRTPLRTRAGPPPEYPVRWLDADLPAYDFGIGVLHIMGSTPKLNERRGAAKTQFWEAVLSAAQSRHGEPFVFVGDLNTGALIDDQKFFCAEHFQRMTDELGWTDLWRKFNGNAAEYTWFSKRKEGRKGFRIDHAFASSALLPRVVNCRYSHCERETGISDHSVLVVEIS
jgi:exodeoxyribonuclease-3